MKNELQRALDKHPFPLARYGYCILLLVLLGVVFLLCYIRIHHVPLIRMIWNYYVR